MQQPNPTQQLPQFQPPIPPSKKKSRKLLWLILTAVILGLTLIIVLSCASSGKSQQQRAQQDAQNLANDSATLTASSNGVATAQTQDLQIQATLTALAATPTALAATPTQSPAESEKAYKASATDTTVADLDKKGNSGKGDTVHFTATILDFVKDSNGNTAAANVTTDMSSSVIQVVFPDNIDVTKLNENDTLEVWRMDAGVFSGTNAYGGTVQEVGVQAQYLTDQTTGYQAG